MIAFPRLGYWCLQICLRSYSVQRFTLICCFQKRNNKRERERERAGEKKKTKWFSCATTTRGEFWAPKKHLFNIHLQMLQMLEVCGFPSPNHLCEMGCFALPNLSLPLWGPPKGQLSQRHWTWPLVALEIWFLSHRCLIIFGHVYIYIPIYILI